MLKVLRALADEARLRILLVLRERPLAVHELMQVVGMGQSRVSRHLRILAEAGVVSSVREATRIYYGIGRSSSPVLAAILKALDLEKPEDLPPEHLSDLVRLDGQRAEILQKVQEHFSLFDAQSEDYQKGLVDSNLYRNWLLDVLPAHSQTLADLGCGSGGLALKLKGRAEKIIGIDQNQEQLRMARMRFPEGDFRSGSLENLPLATGLVDCVLAGMVLHHVPAPEVALHEIRRILRPGGHLFLADLAAHQVEAMREHFADYWLGFDVDRLTKLLVEAGFVVDAINSARGQGELEMLLVRAHLPAIDQSAVTLQSRTHSDRLPVPLPKIPGRPGATRL